MLSLEHCVCPIDQVYVKSVEACMSQFLLEPNDAELSAHECLQLDLQVESCSCSIRMLML